MTVDRRPLAGRFISEATVVALARGRLANGQRSTVNDYVMITVRLPEPLRNGHETVTVHEPVATLGDLIAVLEKRVPSFADDRDELFNFAVNGELVLHGEKNVKLRAGDEVEIVVAFSGG